MARKMTEWPSKRGPITKIMPSDGCIGDTVPLAVGKWYDFHEFGWYMGNVGTDNRTGLLNGGRPALPVKTISVLDEAWQHGATTFPKASSQDKFIYPIPLTFYWSGGFYMGNPSQEN